MRKPTVAILSLAAIILASGCVQKRQAKFSEEQAKNIFEKATLENGATFTLSTGSVQKSVQKMGETPLVEVTSVESKEGFEGLEPLFQDLEINGDPNKKYEVNLLLTGKKLTAFKRIDGTSAISLKEQQLLTHELSINTGENLVPIFQYDIASYGKAEPIKNKYDEATDQLKIEPTPWEEATHLEIRAHSSARKVVDVPDFDAENLVEKALFNKEVLFTVQTGEITKELKDKNNPDLPSLVKIENVSTSDEFVGLKPLFNEMEILGAPNTEYRFKLKLTKDALTGFKVAKESELSNVEKLLAQAQKEESGEAIVPVFQFSVEKQGILNWEKNLSGEQTFKLKLEETPFEKASHVWISILPSARKTLVSIPSLKDSKTYKISEFTSGIEMEIKTGEGKSYDSNLSKRASFELPLSPVVDVKAPEGHEELASLFQNLQINALGKTNYKVVLKVDRMNLTAYRVATEHESIPMLQIAKKEAKANSELLIPLFQFPVQTYGKLETEKADDGSSQYVAVLKESDWSEATHFEINTLGNTRKEISFTSDASRDLTERMFSASKIQNKVLTPNEIERDLEVRIADESAPYLLKLEGNILSFWKVMSKSLMTSDEKEILADGTDAATCKDAGITIERLPEDCVVLRRYWVSATGIRVVRTNITLDGLKGNTFTAENDESNKVHEMVFIQKFPEPDSVKSIVLQPGSALVKDLKGKTFFFRQALLDSPSSMSLTFPGMLGGLEIVKFEFEDDRMLVVQSKPNVETTGTNDLDRAVLLSIPVSYLRKVTTSPSGAATRPYYDRTSKENPDAIANVNWSQNLTNITSSPLSFYNLDRCLSTPTRRDVNTVDNRLEKDGVLNFTVSKSYDAQNMECFEGSAGGYFDRVTNSFTFEERYSFREVKNLDEEPLLDLPYEAQKRLGFGLFTYTKKVANEWGNTRSLGTEIPLPALWKIKNGETIDYTLTGLPTAEKDKAIKEAVIQSTKEVISDLNVALKKAFKGTKLERQGAYVTLEVDGEKGVKGVFGDLDKNYINWVHRNLDFGLWGIGGPDANPRSGQIENGTVSIYGGNMISSVQSIRMAAEASESFQNITKVKSLSNKSEPKVAPAPEAKAEVEDSDVVNMVPSTHRRETRSTLPVIPTKFNTAEIRDFAEQLSSMSKVSTKSSIDQLMLDHPALKSQLSLTEAFQKLVKTRGIHNPLIAETRFNEALIELNETAGRNGLSDSEIKDLKAKAEKANYLSGVFDKMREHGNCVHMMSTGSLSAGNAKKMKDMTDLQLVMAIYKSTLAHEVGHNLGLRHNFIGSFDKANWNFKEEDSEREYSSIMDYIPDDYLHYDGYGPYDVHAFRAAYTGLLELDETVLKRLGANEGKDLVVNGITIRDGKYIHVDDYKKVLKIKDWIDLTESDVKELPLKKYLYCSDEDANYIPVCLRHDKGTTPSEIVQHYIDNYLEYYSITNFPASRLSFGMSGGYIGARFSAFTSIRQFLEETLYQAINGADGDTINSYAQALVKGMMFFHSVIQTPDAPAFADTYGDHFAKGIVADEQGNATHEFNFDRKWSQGKSFDSIPSRRQKLLGIEYDKAIATIVLTQRDMGFDRYEKMSLRTSFPEVEKLLFTGVTSANTPTVRALEQIMAKRIKPSVFVSELGGNVPQSGFKADPTELMRIYGIIGSIVNLQVPTINSDSDISRQFAIESGTNPPQGVQYVVKPGDNPLDPRSLKFWAAAGAGVAERMIDETYSWEVLRSTKPLFEKWMNAYIDVELDKLGIDPATTRGGKPKDDEPQADKPKVDYEAELKKTEANVNALLKQLNPEEPDTTENLMGLMNQVKMIAAQVDSVEANSNPNQLNELKEHYRNLIESVAVTSPALGAMFGAWPSEWPEALKMPHNLNAIAPRTMLENRAGLIFSSLETLNSIFYSLHPEHRN